MHYDFILHRDIAKIIDGTIDINNIASIKLIVIIWNTIMSSPLYIIVNEIDPQRVVISWREAYSTPKPIIGITLKVSTRLVTCNYRILKSGV